MYKKESKVSDIDFVDVPESFITPDEEFLPEVIPVSLEEQSDVDAMAEVVVEKNPGFSLGLVATVLSIIPILFVVGLPLSIASVSKSRKASRSSALGVVAFILNLLALLGTVFLVVVFLGLVEGTEAICSSITGGSTIMLPTGQSFTCPA